MLYMYRCEDVTMSGCKDGETCKRVAVHLRENEKLYRCEDALMKKRVKMKKCQVARRTDVNLRWMKRHEEVRVSRCNDTRLQSGQEDATVQEREKWKDLKRKICSCVKIYRC